MKLRGYFVIAQLLQKFSDRGRLRVEDSKIIDLVRNCMFIWYWRLVMHVARCKVWARSYFPPLRCLLSTIGLSLSAVAC
jgi:hypothetical protein